MKNTKKFGLAAIVASGLTASILGVGSPIHMSASAETLPVLELPGNPTRVDHGQWIKTVYPAVAVAPANDVVQQNR